MAAELDKGGIAKAYARWAPIYDLVFGAVFDRGRRAAIAAAERIGGRILEVGVGTGISLPEYSCAHRLVGVDLSEPMVRRAHERVAAQRLAHVEGLAVMDAARLAFSLLTCPIVRWLRQRRRSLFPVAFSCLAMSAGAIIGTKMAQNVDCSPPDNRL